LIRKVNLDYNIRESPNTHYVEYKIFCEDTRAI